ncbi:MATE family efflux transporter [Tabrizicola sp.]|uniref:MATE family efflux transporter n=1 Tax=Tabrizicola sp. TaxID=2005166 RepID=UPI003F4070FB
MSTLQTDIGPAPGIAARVRPRLIIEEGRALLRLAAPIMLISLVNMGMSVTDTAMISAMFGAEALASVAVGSDLYSVLFYLGAGVLAGLSPFYTAAALRKDPAELARLARIGFAVVALLASVLVVVVWTAPNWLKSLGLDPVLLDAGQGYTRAMALTLVPMLGVALYRTILTAAEKPKVFLKVTLAMLPLNAVGNWVLMTGIGPFPDLGPTGAGVSTLIVATTTLIVLALVAGDATTRNTRKPKTSTVDWGGLVTVLRVGLPIGIATVGEVGIFLAATIYAATLGAEEVAAHTLTLRTAGVAYAIPTAILQAAMVRMGRAETLGLPSIRSAVTASSLILSLGFGALLCLALTLGAGTIAYGFFDDSPTGLATAGIALGLLMILGVTELIVGPVPPLRASCGDARTPKPGCFSPSWATGPSAHPLQSTFANGRGWGSPASGSASRQGH